MFCFFSSPFQRMNPSLSISLAHLSFSNIYSIKCLCFCVHHISPPFLFTTSFSKDEKLKESMRHLPLSFLQRRCCETNASLAPFFSSFDHLCRKICIIYPTVFLIGKAWHVNWWRGEEEWRSKLGMGFFLQEAS